MKKIFEKNMFWITLTLMIFVLVTRGFYISMGTWNLNRTIGWGWDYTNQIWMILSNCFTISLPLFTIGYGILYFLKRKTVFIFSVLHFSLILLMTFYHSGHLILTMLLLNLSWLLFSLNIYKSEKV